MDKILAKMLETQFGRSFITGVFVAMSTAIAALAAHDISQMSVIQQLNDRLIETEQRHRAENDARWRADIERSQALLERLQQATSKINKKKQ